MPLNSYNAILLLLALLTIISIFSTLFSFRAGAPILLVFLGVGLLAGENGIGGINFNDAHSAYTIGSIALALILFDSGFRTPMRIFKLAAWPALSLSTVGVLITAFTFACAAHFIFGIGWTESLLLGAILSPTDAAAVFFLMRVGGITLRERVRATLEIESGSNDPTAVFLTVSLVSLLATQPHLTLEWTIIYRFFFEMGLGVFFGVLGGLGIAFIVNRIELEGGLYAILVAAMALALFAIANLLEGSGFLAVYVAGLLAATKKIKKRNELTRFQQGLTWLAQIAMFVTLGLLATPSRFLVVLLPSIALGLFLILIARPLAAAIALAPFAMSWRERGFIGLVGLRGAVSILLGILPIAANLEHAEWFFNTTFIIVLVSLLIQGWGLKPLAQWMGMVLPVRKGAIDRIHLDLPDETAHELVAYRLHPNSPLLNRSNQPRWIQPALVVREGRSIRHIRLDRLRAGDVIYVFVRPHRMTLLDRLIASPKAPDKTDREFFGDFTVDLEMPISDIAEFYAAEINSEKSALSVRHFLEQEFGAIIEVGDRISLGHVELIVRELDSNRRVLEAGLSVRNPSN